MHRFLKSVTYFVCGMSWVYLLTDNGLLHITFYKCKGSCRIERGQQNVLQGKTVNHLREENKLMEALSKEENLAV